MPRYTETKEFSFSNLVDSRVLVVNGSVTINAWDGANWVLSDIVQTGTSELFTKEARIQIVPDVGSSYFIGVSDSWD